MRRLIASNAVPRSTKNGSSRWPANTLPPPDSEWIAWFATLVELGIVFGPALFGETGIPRLLRDELALLELLARDRVALLDLELGIVNPAHARQGVQERVLVQVVRLERELVTDVVHAVTRVVDVDVVVRAVIEPVEVRAARGILERDPVCCHRQRARGVWRRERVDIGVVRGWVQRRQRGLAVTRAEAQGHSDCRRGKDRREEEPFHSSLPFGSNGGEVPPASPGQTG